MDRDGDSQLTNEAVKFHDDSWSNGGNIVQFKESSKEDGVEIAVQETTTDIHDEEPGILRNIFSWRTIIYLLFHITFITLNLPMASANMVFVCIETKRAEVLRVGNASGLITDINVWHTELEGRKNNSDMTYNKTLSVWDVYGYTMGDINWDSGTKGLILSGVLFLSCLGPALLEAFRQKLGSRLVITMALIWNTVLLLSSPYFARTSPYLLFTSQMLIGLMMGGNVPVIGAVLPWWTPEKQRLTAIAFCFSGYNVGSVIASLMNGFLCSITIDNGWPFIYYVSGAILGVFAVAWFVLMSDSPETHPFISESEKTYIQATRPQSLGEDKNKNDIRPPYAAIIKSVPVLTYIYVYTTFMWSISVVFVYLPIYLNSVHGFPADVTGIIFALMACTRVIGSIAWTLLGNFLTDNGLLSQSATRKVCICVGMAVAGCGSFTVSFYNRDNSWAAIALIVVSLLFQSVCINHVSALPLDLAPQYGGILMSMGMSVGLLIGMTGPLTVAILTPTGSYSEWKVVWYIVSAVFFSAGLAYLIFGQAEIQPWAEIAPPTIKQHENLEIQPIEMTTPTNSLQHVTQSSQSDSLEVDNNLEVSSTLSQSRRKETNKKESPMMERDNLAFEEDCEHTHVCQTPEILVTNHGYDGHILQGESQYQNRNTNPDFTEGNGGDAFNITDTKEKDILESTKL